MAKDRIVGLLASKKPSQEAENPEEGSSCCGHNRLDFADGKDG